MISTSASKPLRVKVHEHRQRLRGQGLRPIQVWVPDMRAFAFLTEAHRQSLAVSTSDQPAEDQAFVDAISDRGDIWIASGGKDYACRVWPVFVAQDDGVDATDSVIVRAFNIDQTDVPLFRLVVESSENNGLRSACCLMVSKITTAPRTKVGRLDGIDTRRAAPR